MQMILYNNKSDNRYVSKRLATLATINNVYLKDETQLVTPTIILDELPDNCNYCKLPTFNRYYYLTDVDFIEGQYYTKWRTDVLMSFLPMVSSQECIVKRCATMYDMYLKDDETMIESYTRTHVIPFPQGFDSDRQEFVLAVVGNTSDTPNNNT